MDMIPFFIRMMDPAEEEKSIHSQPEGSFPLSCNPYDPRAIFKMNHMQITAPHDVTGLVLQIASYSLNILTELFKIAIYET